MLVGVLVAATQCVPRQVAREASLQPDGCSVSLAILSQTDEDAARILDSLAESCVDGGPAPFVVREKDKEANLRWIKVGKDCRNDRFFAATTPTAMNYENVILVALTPVPGGYEYLVSAKPTTNLFDEDAKTVVVLLCGELSGRALRSDGGWRLMESESE